MVNNWLLKPANGGDGGGNNNNKIGLLVTRFFLDEHHHEWHDRRPAARPFHGARSFVITQATCV
jgi:hypothetical protein